MTLMDKESWDAMCEDTKRTIKNIKSAQKSERNRILKIIKEIGELWQIAQEDQYGKFDHYQFNESALYNDIIRKIKTHKTGAKNNG